MSEILKEHVGCSCYPRGNQPNGALCVHPVGMESTTAEALSQSKSLEHGQGKNKSTYRHRAIRSLLLPIILRGDEWAPVSEPPVHRPSAVHRTPHQKHQTRSPSRNATRRCQFISGFRTRGYQTIQSRTRGMNNEESFNLAQSRSYPCLVSQDTMAA